MFKYQQLIFIKHLFVNKKGHLLAQTPSVD